MVEGSHVVCGRAAVGCGMQGVRAPVPYAFGPSQGRKGMKEISSQILIDSFIYKNCKHKYYVN